jgi:predicted methyltransferase
MAVILMLSDDLVDTSRVGGPARLAGHAVTKVRTPAELIAAAGLQPALLVLDLHLAGSELPAILTAFAPQKPRVVGFGSHVHADLLRDARQSGCHLVLPRSAFFERVGTELPAWLEAGNPE